MRHTHPGGPMSKHRAADTTLVTDTGLRDSPLGRQLAELAERAVAANGEDPQFAALHDHIASVADLMTQAMADMTERQQRLDARYAELLTLLERQAGRADLELAAARTSGESGTQLLAEVREARTQLQGSTGLLTGAQAVLEAGVRRMQTSGDALMRYLDDRDVAVESERDRVLREVLEDFAASLHARERRTLSRRFLAVVDRRRDARDAARWRRERAIVTAPAAAAEDATGQTGSRVIDLDAAARRRAQSVR